MFALVFAFPKVSSSQENSEKPFLLNYDLEAYTVSGVHLLQSTGTFQFGFGLHGHVQTRLNQLTQIGLGIGYEQHAEESYLPIYLNTTIAFKDNRQSPFLNARLGYAIGWHDDFEDINGFDFEGGLMAAFNAGYKLSFTNETSFYMFGGLRYQLSSLEVNDIAENDMVYLGFNVGAGISF